MTIGIVLAAVPGYSETFFRSKICFLKETKGIEVVLFVDRKMANVTWSECRVVYGSPIRGKRFWGSIILLFQTFRVCLMNPIRSFKLFTMNRRTDFGLVENIKSLVQSAHLLNSELDWLHFGFGTMAIGRENVARVLKAKMAVSFRGFDHYIYPLKNPGCYQTTFLRTDKFHVLSEAMKNQLMNAGIAESKIKVITPAINVTQFQTVKTEVKKADGQLRILTVARLHWIKGLEYTLDSLAILRQKGIHFHYSIVGEGDQYERLVFAVHQLGLKENVTFKGKLRPDEVIKELEHSDLYVQYSIQEGFCNAVLEAQAMGLPCVVSDADGLSENVLNNISGWVVARRDPEALASKIAEVIQMEESTLSRIRNEAVKRVAKDFNLQKQKDSFLEFYEV